MTEQEQQLMESMVKHGGYMGAFYLGLIKSGVPIAQAIRFTIEYSQAMTSSGKSAQDDLCKAAMVNTKKTEGEN